MTDQAPTDPDITVTLPLSAWTVVMWHLGQGAYCNVARVTAAILEQTTPQVQAAAMTNTTTEKPPDVTKPSSLN